MKKIFEIPELEVVRFVEADIVVCSDCGEESWRCASYSNGIYTCAGSLNYGQECAGTYVAGQYEGEGPTGDGCRVVYCVEVESSQSDPYSYTA